MEKAFHVTLKAFFVLKIFKSLSLLFGLLEKRFDLKEKVNFKMYEVTTWETNNCNKLTAQYIKKYKQLENETCSVDRI